MDQCKDQGIDIYRYGAAMVSMAKVELSQNIWAVRFVYLHILKKGLCLRPPWCMVEHIGWDSQGTNAKDAGIFEAPPLKHCPPIPAQWPNPVEQPESARLCQKVYGGGRPTIPGRLYRFVRRLPSKALRAVFAK
jgi:hypothetical protein